MLVIDPSSHCDVCCESFTSLPQCIDCGHIFCSKCLEAICEKTWSPRQLPACPFCRVAFTRETVRKIRVDLKTPRPPFKEIDDDDPPNIPQPSEAKRLEEKVAKAAASKCSFEEVSELHKEIQQWLASEVKRTSAGQHASLQLSAALLRAIILNCVAYAEASRTAKSVETDLKVKLDNTQVVKDQLETEVQKHRMMYSQKVRECQELRSELNRLRLITPAPTNNALRSLAVTPPRSPGSPAPISRGGSIRSVTPHPAPARANYHPRSASTAPSLNNMSVHARNFSVGSAPTSNTFQSALRYQTSPLKTRVTQSRSSSPPLDDGPHQRWLPTSDDDSAASEKRLGSPSPERFFRSTTDRPSTATSASQSRWNARFQPQDVL